MHADLDTFRGDLLWICYPNCLSPLLFLLFSSRCIVGGFASVWYTTQYFSVIFRRVFISCFDASVSRTTLIRISLKPTSTLSAIPSVPRRSKSPSTHTAPLRISIPMWVATAPMTIPAQAASESRKTVAGQIFSQPPPTPGCIPVSTLWLPILLVQVISAPKTALAASFVWAVEGLNLYFSLKGVCILLSCSFVMASPCCNFYFSAFAPE